jgi:hypothetical protein
MKTAKSSITTITSLAALSLATAFISGCASTPTKPANPTYKKVAIIVEDFPSVGVPVGSSRQGIKDSMESALQQALLDKDYQVVDRSSVERALKEIDFQASGLTKEQAARVGQALDCRGLFILTPTHFDEIHKRVTPKEGPSYTQIEYKASVRGKLVDVNTFESPWAKTASYPGSVIDMFRGKNLINPPQNIPEAAGRATEYLAGTIPSHIQPPAK